MLNATQPKLCSSFPLCIFVFNPLLVLAICICNIFDSATRIGLSDLAPGWSVGSLLGGLLARTF